MCHDPQRSVSAAQGDCYRTQNIEYADRSCALTVVVAVKSTVGWKMVSGVQATVHCSFIWVVDGSCRAGKKDER